jgi:diguanylate cyclase
LRWRDGSLSARYYTVAWSALLGGGVILALNKFHILPKNGFTEYAVQIGSALEVILLSFALAERINQERRMRFDAQQEALTTERELRQAREEALTIQKQATESLEQRVKERTTELEDLNRRLEELSATDQLTGLKNRRYLDQTLAEEFARCCRYGHTLAVLLMDIDHFKSFNDTYGHLIGDECLKDVAHCVRKGLRWPSDRAARYGGEEFCVVLPETDNEGALTVAERIRRNVESLNFTVNEKQVPVTISIGVAVLVPTTNLSVEYLLEAADHALYKSKETGRNRVTVHQS